MCASGIEAIASALGCFQRLMQRLNSLPFELSITICIGIALLRVDLATRVREPPSVDRSIDVR